MSWGLPWLAGSLELLAPFVLLLPFLFSGSVVSGLFSLETPDIRCTVSSSSCLPSSPCPLSLAVACAPSVCRLVCLVAMRRVISFLFIAGVAVCFVSFVCGGCAWGVLCFFFVTACLTCALVADRCPRSMHPQSVFFSLSRPLVLLLVVGRIVDVVFSSVFWVRSVHGWSSRASCLLL